MKFFNSKVFWKLIGVFALLDLCLLMSGCGNWENEAISLLSLLGPAMQVALSILVAVGVAPETVAKFQTWATDSQAAITEVQSLITQFQTALADAKPGIINQIEAILTTMSENLSALLTSLQVNNPAIQASVEAVFATISGLLVSILNLLPVLQGKVTSHRDQARLYVEYQDNAQTFKARFNEAAAKIGPQYKI